MELKGSFPFMPRSSK